MGVTGAGFYGDGAEADMAALDLTLQEQIRQDLACERCSDAPKDGPRFCEQCAADVSEWTRLQTRVGESVALAQDAIERQDALSAERHLTQALRDVERAAVWSVG